MRSNANQTIFNLPNKLPMICPPKEYIYSMNSRKVLRLGGYLLNDIKYTEGIFIFHYHQIYLHFECRMYLILLYLVFQHLALKNDN